MLVRYLPSRWTGLALVIAAIVLLAAGCEGGGEEAPAAPAGTPTAEAAEGTPTSPDGTPAADGEGQAPTVSGGSAIDGVVAYVTETGLDGKTFEPASPINCTAFLGPAGDPSLRQAAEGKICIDFQKSRFTQSEGVMTVVVVGSEETWELRLELRNTAWVVTGAERAEE